MAAWLSGVRKVGDLELGTMRGPLFETWVISEFIKYLYNHALPNRLYFWRDSAGNEIDLLVEHGPESAFPVECKSGRTVAADWFKPFVGFLRVGEIPGFCADLRWGGKSTAK